MCRSPRALQLQREAAVTRNLLEHVVEEADAAADLDGQLLIEIDGRRDFGLARVARDVRATFGTRQAARNLRPRFTGAAVAPCAYSR